MNFYLSIIPPIILLIYIYKLDRKEKEPFSLLRKLFLYGVIATLPICAAETVVTFVTESITAEGTVMYAILRAFVVAALCEEIGKYLVVKIFVWNSRQFNCTFDGIVYSTFVSLGFATLENILYVTNGGISTAIGRMFTAIPGHMSFGVVMGYYLSKAKVAKSDDDIAGYKKNIKKTLLMPILLHGIYDSLLMIEEEIANEIAGVLSVLTWYAFIIVLFVAIFIIVNKASKDDHYFGAAVWLDK